MSTTPRLWYFEDDADEWDDFETKVRPQLPSLCLETSKWLESYDEFAEALRHIKSATPPDPNGAPYAVLIDLNLSNNWSTDDRERFELEHKDFLDGFLNGFPRFGKELRWIATGFLLASECLRQTWTSLAIRTNYASHTAIDEKLNELKDHGAEDVFGKTENPRLINWLTRKLQQSRCLAISSDDWRVLRCSFGKGAASANPWHLEGGHQDGRNANGTYLTNPTRAAEAWEGKLPWRDVITDRQKSLLVRFGYPSDSDTGVLQGKDGWRLPPLRVLLQCSVAKYNTGDRDIDLSLAIELWSESLARSAGTAVRVSADQSVKGHDYWWFNVSALLAGLEILLTNSESAALHCYVDFCEVQFHENDSFQSAPGEGLSGGLLIRVDEWTGSAQTPPPSELVFNSDLAGDIARNGPNKAMFQFWQLMRMAGVCWIVHAGRRRVENVLGPQGCGILIPVATEGVSDDKVPFQFHSQTKSTPCSSHLITGQLLMFIAANQVDNPFDSALPPAWVVAKPVSAAEPSLRHFGLVE